LARVGLVSDPVFLQHETGGHPERKERLQAILAVLAEEGLLDRLTLIPPQEVDLNLLAKVHHPEYIRAVRDMAVRGGGMWDADTIIAPQSYRVALMAAGGTVRAVDEVMQGDLDSAFALVRPPGHHAEPHRAMGFCLFNNVAIAAAHAREHFGLERILILDWDVHHGNGTQVVFEDDPGVLFISAHQSPLYPGTGALQEVGMGAGKGYTVNLPMPRGSGDRAYYYLFKQVVEPIALEFVPQLVLVSAGFDGHHADPLAGLQLTSRGYGQMAEMVMDIAARCCNGKVVMVLEGGYNLDVIGYAVASVISRMFGLDIQLKEPVDPPKGEFLAIARERVDAAKNQLGAYWKLLP